jgi:hypothetical protein
MQLPYQYSNSEIIDLPDLGACPPSPSAMTTVNPKISPCHEAAGVAKQEDSRPSVLLRVAQSLEHVGIRPCSPSLGERLEQASGHGCDDVARRKGVDANAVLSPLRGEVTGEL